jgi:hypothetical protein
MIGVQSKKREKYRYIDRGYKIKGILESMKILVT